MSTEEIQAKYDRLVDRVRQMRGWQKEFFKFRASGALKRSRRLEWEVDQLLKEEVKIQEAKQKELF